MAAKKEDITETTIDNKATYTQIDYLGKLITASLLKPSPPGNLPKYKEAYLKGVDYLLSSQYENGGFPQYYPLKKGYYTHITFNDDAMIGVLSLLRDIANGNDDHKFVDEALAQTLRGSRYKITRPDPEIAGRDRRQEDRLGSTV